VCVTRVRSASARVGERCEALSTTGLALRTWAFDAARARKLCRPERLVGDKGGRAEFVADNVHNV
jgi:hypothetical protein